MNFSPEKLIRDVFNPSPGERAAILVDEPTDQVPDHPDWQDRRAMAESWRQALIQLELDVPPLLLIDTVGANNADLPETLRMGGESVSLPDTLGSLNILLAMTEFSATAPLAGMVRQHRTLRVASMPRVLRRMEQSALAADYPAIAKRVHALADRLNRSDAAEVEFSSGDRCRFDLRYRRGMSDDGSCRPDSPNRIINLPSGEAFIVPYEGERPGEPSQTEGTLPVSVQGERIRLHVKANRIESVSGANPTATEFESMLHVDPARRNIAELGLGCNDRAVITGNVLEDEKAGFHWAFGRSEHLGGTVGPSAFLRPDTVVHQDTVYAPGCPEEARTLSLSGPEGYHEIVLKNGRYTVDFDE